MDSDYGLWQERRRTERLEINIPVKYRAWKSAAPDTLGVSLDISEGGIHFATSSAVAEGDTLEVCFDMPSELVDEPTAEWRCTGQAIRVQPIDSGKFGVRVRFDCYQIARPQGTTHIYMDLNSLRFGAPPAPPALR
jgi:PilZ domain